MKHKFWIVAAALVFGFATMAEAAQRPYTIGLLNPYIGNTWRAQYLEMAEEAQRIYQENGKLKELVIATCNNDVSQQLNQMNNMINSGVDCILLDPSSVTALGTGIQRAINEGILVIIASAPAPYEGTINYTHDNKAFVNVNCTWLVDKLGGKGNIVEITGLVGNPADQIRIEIHDEILAGTDIKVLGSAPANWSPTEAQTVMAQFLSTYDNIDGVLQQDVTAPGVLRAYEIAGKQPAPMVGDCTFGFLRAWKEKNLDSIAFPMHPGIIVELVGIACHMLDGKEIDPQFLQPNLFDEELVNMIPAEPPFIVTAQAQPDAPWMKGKRFTKALGIDEAVSLGEGKSAEAMLDGYISDEQLATYFK